MDIWGKMSTPEAGFDLMIVNDGAGTDPNRSLSFFFGTGAGANVFGFSNERVDELCALGIATTDETQREEYYNEAQLICIDDCTKILHRQPHEVFRDRLLCGGVRPLRRRRQQLPRHQSGPVRYSAGMRQGKTTRRLIPLPSSSFED